MNSYPICICYMVTGTVRVNSAKHIHGLLCSLINDKAAVRSVSAVTVYRCKTSAEDLFVYQAAF